MSGRKPKPPREELERMYLEEDKTKEEIKKIYRVSSSTIYNWFKNYGIATRNCRWSDEDTWTQYGVDNGYDGRNPTSLSSSKDKDEKSWYRRGSKIKDKNGKSALRRFQFNWKKHKEAWEIKEEWTIWKGQELFLHMNIFQKFGFVVEKLYQLI